MPSPLPQVSELAMSDSINRHARSEDYVYRMPTPPRIVIPPLSGWNHAESAWDLGGIISRPDPVVNIDFLNGTDYSRPLSKKTVGNWKYNNRREAQAILSFLYLGPVSAAKDRDFLRREGITMLLAIQHKSTFGANLTIGAMRVADEMGLVKATIEVAHNQELISQFPAATRAVNSHLREMHNRASLNPAGGIPPGKVLIFCESGNEKSAGVAAAYLMNTFNDVDNVKACQICNACRFCCSFDDNMKQLLKTYDDIIKAKRSVEVSINVNENRGQVQPVTNPFFGTPVIHAPQPQASPRSFSGIISARNCGGTKRSREVDDNDMDVDEDEMDDDRFMGREMAPFR